MRVHFNQTGKGRKKMAAVISKATGQPSTYIKMPTNGYRIGNFSVDENGTLIWENIDPAVVQTVLDTLRDNGFEESETESTPAADFSATRIPFNQTGKGRKRMVAVISKTIGQPSAFIKMPTNGYEIGEFKVDQTGTLVCDDVDPAVVQTVLEALRENGYIPESAKEPEPDSAPSTEQEDTPPAVIPADNVLVIEYPMTGFTPEKLSNLHMLVDSKASLIKKALGVTELPIHVSKQAIGFPWFHGALDGESVHAYSQFIAALCESAKRKTRVVARDLDRYDNARFSFRVWLVTMGMIGPAFSLARKLLVTPLPGNGAWRYGPPPKPANPLPPQPDVARWPLPEAGETPSAEAEITV